jgi:Na+/proline symporter
MGWLYVFMGVIISSAVLPATLTLMWDGQNRMAATLSPILGLICSITAWLVTTSKLNDGAITVATSGANNPMLAGNLVALLSPMLFIPVLTLIFGKGTLHHSHLTLLRLIQTQINMIGSQ